MNSLTRTLLVLLRLFIGWHLLFAGLAKFQADYRGSEGYLQESIGPFSPIFHWMTGDRLADLFAVRPLGADQDPARTPLHQRMPEALQAEWEAYFQRFVRHYELDPEQQQLARKKLEQEEDRTVDWLLHGSKLIKKTSPYGPPIEVTMTVPERVREYEARRAEIARYQSGEYGWSLHTLFGPTKTRELQAEKADLARVRADLLNDLDSHTSAMKEALRDVLTTEQAARGPVREPVRVGWMEMSRLDWVDFLVRWGLTVAGALLLLGLFTRPAAVLGAALILSFYLAVPPLPGIPENLRLEGYPYVNKNLIEVLTLLLLATTQVGRWAGLDALIQAWRRPGQQAALSDAASRDGLARPDHAGRVREAAATPTDRDRIP